MTTPLTNEAQIDSKAIEHQVEFLGEKGVHSIYPCGTTGEMMKLGADKEIFKAILDFRGQTGGYTRKSLLDLDESEREILKAQISPYLP